MTKRVPVTYREWLLFGVRWLMLATFLLLLTIPEQSPSPLDPEYLIVVIATIISGLTVLLLLLSDYWSRLLLLLTIGLDVVLTVVMVYVGGPILLWVGLIPVITAGAYFDWVVGLMAGVFTAGGALALYLALTSQITPSEAVLALVGAFLLIAAGPLVSVLSKDPLLEVRIQEYVRRQKELGDRASAYMQAVHEVAAVLAASRLDPARVLDSVLAFGLPQLEQVGAKGTLSGVILLVDQVEDETVLRVARDYQMPPGDRRVVIPGLSGAANDALESGRPVIGRSPGTDAELRLFEGFRECRTAVCVPMHSGTANYGVMVVGSTEQDAFDEIQIELLQTVANQATASLQNAQLYASLLEQRDRIVNVEKDARAKLAGELHDGPTQGVSTIAMRVSYIRQLLKRKPEQIPDELYQVEELARRTAREIRHMLFTLRPAIIETQGLQAALEQLAVKMQETFEQHVEVVAVDNLSDMLDQETATELFSITVEAVGNAQKHAQADTITIRLGVLDENLVLEIEDDGIGFDVEEALARAPQRTGHLGLLNLQDRAALIEGTLDIHSSPGAGSKITVTIPMEYIRRKKAEDMAPESAAQAQPLG